MSSTETNCAQVCLNVMEALVNQEIKQQLLHLPVHLAKYINKVEVMTYAMNRLPALYASSEKGWQHQISHAKREFGKEITVAVRQALVAVQRDPLRTTTPLKKSPDEIASSEALQKLKELLQDEQLSWSNLAFAVEQTLLKTVQGEITWKSKHHIHRSGYQWNDTRYNV